MFLGWAFWAIAQNVETLPQTEVLTWEGDLSVRMVEGIDRFLMRELEQSVAERPRHWKRDGTSRAAYEASVQPNRERLRTCIGAGDPRLPVPALDLPSTTVSSAQVAEATPYTVWAVRWPVFPGVHGEGLLLEPKETIRGRIVALPDADQTPEMLVGLAPGLAAEAQYARRLAECGCQVLVPVLIDRRDTWSGNPALNRFTNQPHREWIYRQAYELGRHIIGYEVQKVLAAVDWFAQGAAQAILPAGPASNQAVKIGVAGYGEGGLLALYSAALDPRIDAALVSGYFDSRQRVWSEPIYRNVFGLLQEFGDAEIASLIAPRALIIEYAEVPKVDGPPAPRSGRAGAAPGALATPERYVVEAEVTRARALLPKDFPFPLEFIYGNEGTPVGPGSTAALGALVRALGGAFDPGAPAAPPAQAERARTDPDARQRGQVQELVDHTQRLLRLSERVREESFWRPLKPSPTNDWAAACLPHRRRLAEEVIGRFPKASMPGPAKSRKILDRPKWTGYEVVLDVWPDVFAWGYLLLPKELQPGERRPVVVCQHGLEGVPADTIHGPAEPGYAAYRSFAAKLAERGFIVFAPHNPYRGQDKFRVLQRKANPLRKSLFSVIVAQHDRILDWLTALPYVDPQRVAFYGLSYGGKTAMRVPALLERYCLSICSADFNEWVRKNATVDSPYSYLFTGEYEMPEFDLGHTFNYAEMAALIAPRPFMVERGHFDGVAPDEWVAYEYARVRRLYAQLGIPEKTEIEFFDGPHTIHGIGTFQFLYRHLKWQPR
jgi:dienelactone hydrolase